MEQRSGLFATVDLPKKKKMDNSKIAQCSSRKQKTNKSTTRECKNLHAIDKLNAMRGELELQYDEPQH